MAGQQGAQALARVGMQGLGAAAAITRNKVANTLCALETVHLMVSAGVSGLQTSIPFHTFGSPASWLQNVYVLPASAPEHMAWPKP